MGNIIKKESWLGRSQLQYTERCLWWDGMMNRRSLVEKFNCSGQQASAVIQAYKELNPEAMSYDLSIKRYLANPKMTCVFGKPSFRNELLKDDELVGQVIQPIKEVDQNVTRYLMVAIRQNRAITITYQSRSQIEAEKREIVPTAFGFDGVRYHVRAWCAKRKEYRDFSLLRIQAIKWPEKAVVTDLSLDLDWETWEELRIKINHSASSAVKNALMEDYGLFSIDEPIIIKCRKAMKPYVLYRMGLDAYSDLPNVSFFEMG